MKLEKLSKIIGNVTFPEYDFYIGGDADSGMPWTVYAEYEEECVVTGDVMLQTTREWPIPPGATKSDVVRTMLKLVLTSTEHRVREHFLYKDKPIFGPHQTVEKLLEITD